MERIRRVGSVVAWALVCLVTACGGSRTHTAELADRKEASAAPVQASPSALANSGALATRVSSSSAIFEKCSDAVRCAMNPSGAVSEAEARWMERNGYPTESELSALHALSDGQLAARAKLGSLPAMVVYGERLSLAGNTEAGMTMLLDAANRGSIYSYYGFSRVYRDVPGLQDHLSSAAYLRVANILGDSKAAQQMLRDFPGFGPAEYSVVDRRASELYRTLARQRRPSVRPSD